MKHFRLIPVSYWWHHQLGEYLPSNGDQLAVFGFCRLKEKEPSCWSRNMQFCILRLFKCIKLIFAFCISCYTFNVKKNKVIHCWTAEFNIQVNCFKHHLLMSDYILTSVNTDTKHIITWEVLERILFKADLNLVQVQMLQAVSVSVQVRDSMKYGGTSMGWWWVLDSTDSLSSS